MSSATKTITFSVHAKERMVQRNVSHNQVAVAVRSPTRTLPGNTQYTTRLEKDFPGSRFLVVIIEENDAEIKVVTVYWS